MFVTAVCVLFLLKFTYVDTLLLNGHEQTWAMKIWWRGRLYDHLLKQNAGWYKFGCIKREWVQSAAIFLVVRTVCKQTTKG